MNFSQNFIRKAFAFLLIALTGVSLYADEKNHIIEELDFVIEGNTRENAIRRFLEVKRGSVFQSEEDMLELLLEEKQHLVNYRVFDSVGLQNEILREDDSAVYWGVTYTVVESWTFVPIPYPKYSTNSGFRLALQMDYTNALGTMTDVNLNVGFNVRTNELTDKPELTQWNFSPNWSGIRLSDKIRISFDADMSQKEQEYTSGDPLTQYYYSYYSTGVGTTLSFNLPGFWSYSISPHFDFRYGYKDKRNWGNVTEEPFNVAANQSISWGRINWIANLRQGQNYALTHQIRYVISTDKAEQKLVQDIDLSARWYFLLGEQLNFYHRLATFYTFNDERSGAGGMIRGVNDSDLAGHTGVYLQNSLGFPFWIWEGVWDAQIHPFFDIGVVGNFGEFSYDDLKYGAGVDLVLYLDKLPSLVARATIGFNLSDRELGGLGEKLELDITSSLSY